MKLSVGKKEVAIKLHENGRVIGLLPEFKDDENVPDYVLFMLTILILIKTDDKRFAKYIRNRWKEIEDQNDENEWKEVK